MCYYLFMLEIVEERKKGSYKCRARCTCGKIFTVSFYALKSGNTKSCGCLRRKKMREEAKKRFTGKKPSNFIDYTGKKIGLVTVLKRIEDRNKWSTTYLCQCECGTKFTTEMCTLRRADYRFCKCGPRNHPLKKLLLSMNQRCTNPNEPSYKWYGGKGIKVYEEWLKYPIKFIKWSEENGWTQKKHKSRKYQLSIDRIDSNKDYCPENCQWLSIQENSKKAMKERWGNDR